MIASSLRRARAAAAVTAAGLIVPLGACTPATTGLASSSPADSVSGLPGSHIHGMAVNDQTGQILLATHEGLFDISHTPATKIGPTNDLMGFTTAHDGGIFYASGHPGKDSTLPNPVGLIRSGDGGETWEQLSRQQESDFHALTTTKSGIVAFDGTLMTSPDGKNWTKVAAGFTPAVLAGNAHSDTVLATTPQGLHRSTDAGTTWTLNNSAPVVQYAAFASTNDVVGVQPDGSVQVSADSGATWSSKGRISGSVQAIAAVKTQDGTLRIWAATDAGVETSADGGATFAPYQPG
ncbi:F510_1955 family glycosylhydrolase [Arthrobacter sp. MW3 TE3886]|uniref:F510_1955 family glycosylhydrolase n=1 Tax=Arthrobacter sp. MW3 TE3886 TaxID=3156254 RepID=UPI003512050C